MVVLLTLLIVIFLTPASWLGWVLQGLRHWYEKNDPLQRGEVLYHWMDSFGPQKVSFNLGNALPEESSYHPFSKILHQLWHDFQRQGGNLSELLRPLKLLLREDLKRARRQRQVIQGAFTQLVFMAGLVWIYLISFSYLMGVSFPAPLIAGLLGWQVFGVIIYVWCLGLLKEKHFRPFQTSLDQLLQLVLISQNGCLGQAHLVTHGETKLPRDHHHLTGRMQELLIKWKNQGFASKDEITPMREDLMLLASDHTELFLGRLKALSFLWAITFVLPSLFAGSLFGLYKLAVV